MILGIDASNIRVGGGVTHLVELLRAAEPKDHRFSQVIVWGGQRTLSRIDDRPWLLKSHQTLLEKSLPYRIFWQLFRLARLARLAGCDVLFVPGGSYAGDFHPVVTMSRNLLPFEWRELRRWGWSWLILKGTLLRWIQSRTFRHSEGVIFLTHYARAVVMGRVTTSAGETTIIPHGVNQRFFCPPREQRPISQYSADRPFRVLYVSIIDMYKHQWHVAEAIAQLRETGLPVMLEMIGPDYPPALARLNKTLDRIDSAGKFIRYGGNVRHIDLPQWYQQADMSVFASSCENMPNILLESMAAGLPIACSNKGPMREVLRDGGVYFDPEQPEEIAYAIRKLILSPPLRQAKAKAAFERAQRYSWEHCAEATFGFLAKVCKT